MAKLIKSLRKQADKAERAAESAHDADVADELHAMARAYRAQADVIGSKKAKGKKDVLKRRSKQ
ncbi:hypothetical protein JQ615_10350 [Bradyrhizobium jicamae]|uniref:30S ribosomal protein S20 n=1 Tax=Bradyrhizobium jicamae TaxID=280332 RepID=A0ABS5FG90_9BRAD|nr:hypothetical protein [Bradyrhizobium jicamae]MBR0795790.1 hypothetical protein [Bradyrhizobium jicamae]MBR0933813.1 hypothetical protein [Bradyrhizobium jicamae]